MSTVPIATSCVPRRCGADSDTKKPSASSWNCTYGAKQPFYRLQKVEDNVRLSYLSSSPPLSVPHALDQAPLIVFTSRCSKASTRRHTPSTCSFSRSARRRTSSRSRRCPCLTRRACRWGSTMRERRGGDGRGCDADGGERTDDDEYACAECVEFVFIVERDCTGCHALALSSESS